MESFSATYDRIVTEHGPKNALPLTLEQFTGTPWTLELVHKDTVASTRPGLYRLKQVGVSGGVVTMHGTFPELMQLAAEMFG